MATNKQIAENVLKAVGGKENVVNLAHCFTRLRFTLKDESKVDQDALRKTQGVIQLIMAGGQCQVVVGSKVDALYDLICETYGISTAVEENDVADGQKHNPINTLMNTMSGVLAPTLGILTAAGIIKGVISLFASLGWVSTTSGVYMQSVTASSTSCPSCWASRQPVVSSARSTWALRSARHWFTRPW